MLGTWTLGRQSPCSFALGYRLYAPPGLKTWGRREPRLGQRIPTDNPLKAPRLRSWCLLSPLLEGT